MFGIPESCKVDQFVSKASFLKNANLKKSEKDILANEIQKITLRFQLEPNKCNILAYKDEIREYPLIVVFQIQVILNAHTKQIASFIMQSIPYPAVLVFTCEQQMQLAVAHQKTNLNDISKNVLEQIIMTDWLPLTESYFDINTMNLRNYYTLYCDILDFISKQNIKDFVTIDSLSGEQARQISKKKADLEAQIANLRAQIKKEKQFNRQVELNMQIKELERELEGIKKQS